MGAARKNTQNPARKTKRDLEKRDEKMGAVAKKRVFCKPRKKDETKADSNEQKRWEGGHKLEIQCSMQIYHPINMLQYSAIYRWNSEPLQKPALVIHHQKLERRCGKVQLLRVLKLTFKR
jgi:hypothetical protein